jgi:hypothetical protein
MMPWRRCIAIDLLSDVKKIRLISAVKFSLEAPDGVVEAVAIVVEKCNEICGSTACCSDFDCKVRVLGAEPICTAKPRANKTSLAVGRWSYEHRSLLANLFMV